MPTSAIDKAKTIRNLRRAEYYLFKSVGIRERSQIRETLDDLTGVNGIGKVLSEAMYNALNGMGRDEWNAVFRWIKDVG